MADLGRSWLSGHARAAVDRGARSNPSMQVQWQHHVDADEPDVRGGHRYHYAYRLYAFADAGAVLHARRYDDTADTASLLGWGANGERRLSEADLAHPLVKETAHWLRADGATQLLWLDRKSGSYLTVES